MSCHGCCSFFLEDQRQSKPYSTTALFKIYIYINMYIDMEFLRFGPEHRPYQPTRPQQQKNNHAADSTPFEVMAPRFPKTSIADSFLQRPLPPSVSEMSITFARDAMRCDAVRCGWSLGRAFCILGENFVAPRLIGRCWPTAIVLRLYTWKAVLNVNGPPERKKTTNQNVRTFECATALLFTNVTLFVVVESILLVLLLLPLPF